MRRRVSFFHRSGLHLKEEWSVVSSSSAGNRGQFWSFRQRLLHAATACERPMGIQIVVHGSGMPWLEGLVRRLADSGVAAESSVPGLDSIEVNGSSRWNESRGLPRSMPSRLAAFVRRTWRDTRVPFWSRRVAACLWMATCQLPPIPTSWRVMPKGSSRWRSNCLEVGCWKGSTSPFQRGAAVPLCWLNPIG